MGDRVFVDTNILIYAIETAGPDPQKTAAALDLIRRDGIVISTQVLGEFYRATTSARRESPLDHQEATVWIQLWKRFDVRTVTVPHVDLALEITERHRVNYYDALILSSARMAKCGSVFSEDLDAGQDYSGVRVINPFDGKP